MIAAVCSWGHFGGARRPTPDEPRRTGAAGGAGEWRVRVPREADWAQRGVGAQSPSVGEVRSRDWVQVREVREGIEEGRSLLRGTHEEGALTGWVVRRAHRLR